MTEHTEESGKRDPHDGERPNFLEIEAVVEHVQQTTDVVRCQPKAPAYTRYLWGTEDGGLYLMVLGKCNYAGDDALRRYKRMLDGTVEMKWQDSDDKYVMMNADELMRRAKA